MKTRSLVDCAGELARAERSPAARTSGMAQQLVGSEILRIAGEIRALVRSGREICNLTVGDFDPRQFAIPAKLRDGIIQALQAGETNYPPSDGVLELRQAVARFYERELGISYAVESVLIAGGARPLLYGIYRTLLDPGDLVVYPVPSWNNNHYVHLAQAVGVPVVCEREYGFLPTRELLAPHLSRARLLCINSPLNPTGTSISSESLAGIAQAVVEENLARHRRKERPLYLLYDQIYWKIASAGVEHATPPGLVPEVAPYTLFVDGISKAFAATGVRVGWSVGPPDVIERLSAVLGHVGAWAPRAEQVACIGLLQDSAAIAEYLAHFRAAIQERLDHLHVGLMRLAAAGHPVESLPPAGTIYLTARLHPFGKRTPSGNLLRSSDDIRKYLLEAAGLAIVPFHAFGDASDQGWFRLSIGAVSQAQIQAMLPRLKVALEALRD